MQDLWKVEIAIHWCYQKYCSGIPEKVLGENLQWDLFSEVVRSNHRKIHGLCADIVEKFLKIQKHLFFQKALGTFLQNVGIFILEGQKQRKGRDINFLYLNLLLWGSKAGQKLTKQIIFIKYIQKVNEFPGSLLRSINLFKSRMEWFL